MSFYTGTPSEKAAEACFGAVMAQLMSLGIYTDLTMAGAMATIRIEVGKAFLPVEEIASGEQYEGRKDLGNDVPGDGVRFKGRGYIQLTGRYNYETYTHLTGIDLVANPKMALDPVVSARIFALYFKNRGCNKACNSQDWTLVRKLVNGGSNGLFDFLKVINQYLS